MTAENEAQAVVAAPAEAKAPRAPKVAALTKRNIFDAGTKEILDFARSEGGLTFAADAGRDYIIQEIFKALDWDAYRPEADATHVVLNLAKTRDEKYPYQGGFNGKMFTIKRGEDVEVPIGYYNTMIEAAERRFRIESVGQAGETQQGGPAQLRMPLGSLDMRVIRFINKGGKSAD